MGRGLDILLGKADTSMGVLPWATGQRSVVGANGSARMVAGSAFGGIDLGSTPRNWAAQPVAYRCVATTAANLASVDMTVLVGDEANDTHEVAQLWNQGPAVASVSARIVRETAFAMAEVRGEAFVYLDRGDTGTGPVRGWAPIYDEVDVVVRGVESNPVMQELAGFRVRRGNQTFGLLPSEVLWLRYPHPMKQWHALAPWAAALGAAELDSYARAWQLGEFKNGAKPGAVIYLGDLDEAAYNAAMAQFRTQVEGPHNSGKSLLVAGPQPAAVNKLTMTAEEMAYLKSRTANADEQMLAFGYRPDYFRGQSTYENQRAAKVAAWSDLYLPKLDVLGSEVDRQLLPDPREQAAFDVSKIDALQENQDAIYNRIRGIAYTDTILVDEARAQLGYDPLPDGRGQATLTEFRARIQMEQAAAQAAADAGTARAAWPQTRAAVLPAIRRRVAHRGVVIPVRSMQQRRRAQTVHRPDPSAFYTTHERVGERVMQALADKQLRVVLRALAKLRTSQVQAWDERHRFHVAHQVPEHRMVEVPGLSPFTALTVTGECDCTRIAADDVFDAGYWRAQTEDAVATWLRGVWEGAGASMADGLGIGFDVFDEQVLHAMEDRRAVLADQVTQTTRRVLDSQLLGITAEEGWSIDDAETAIRGAFDDLSGYRARTIARTEVVGGYNQASSIGARESGLVAARRWLTAEDERVRPSHQRLNGHRLESVTERYPNGLLHPGEPSGDPSEAVNCRCTKLFDLA